MSKKITKKRNQQIVRESPGWGKPKDIHKELEKDTRITGGQFYVPSEHDPRLKEGGTSVGRRAKVPKTDKTPEPYTPIAVNATDILKFIPDKAARIYYAHARYCDNISGRSFLTTTSKIQEAANVRSGVSAAHRLLTIARLLDVKDHRYRNKTRGHGFTWGVVVRHRAFKALEEPVEEVLADLVAAVQDGAINIPLNKLRAYPPKFDRVCEKEGIPPQKREGMLEKGHTPPNLIGRPPQKREGNTSTITSIDRSENQSIDQKSSSEENLKELLKKEHLRQWPDYKFTRKDTFGFANAAELLAAGHWPVSDEGELVRELVTFGLRVYEDGAWESPPHGGSYQAFVGKGQFAEYLQERQREKQEQDKRQKEWEQYIADGGCPLGRESAWSYNHALPSETCLSCPDEHPQAHKECQKRYNEKLRKELY